VNRVEQAAYWQQAAADLQAEVDRLEAEVRRLRAIEQRARTVPAWGDFHATRAARYILGEDR
jgi:hypothetical protein